MKANPEHQRTLLDVQSCDTRLAQLQHKQRSLPEAQALKEAEKRLERVGKELIAAETIVTDLEREQARADADVDIVRERSRKDRELLDSGSINDPKQLQSLESELVSLAKRQTELEDVELEVMERVEGAKAAVVQLSGEKDEMSKVVTELQAQVDASNQDLNQQAIEVESERSSLVNGIPDDLMALYDKIRGDRGGVGAAQLRGGRCEGCHLDLPPSDVSALNALAPDEVGRCDDCRCILVRANPVGSQT